MADTASHSSLLLAGIILVTGLIASAGTTQLPLDAHETFVVQTAQEMHENNNWIVPLFNDQPRLKKPPLNYWITGAVAWLTGSLDHIQPWHGRVASIISALGLVIFAFLLADKLYNRQLAVISALLISTSLGLFNYSHDARPDMLYSLFCTAGFTAFVYAWKEKHRIPKMCFVYGMWATWALATLTKGPHMPAMYLLACLIFSRLSGISWKNILELTRPLSGGLLFVCIAAPWWILLNNSLGSTGLHGTQLSGSLLTIKFKNILKFYYFYRPLLLVLPWVVFIPFTVQFLKQDREYRHASLLMGLLVLVPVIILTIGSQERWFYMLPSIVPMIILLAGGVNHVINMALQGQSRDWLYILAPALVLSALIFFIAFVVNDKTAFSGNEISISASIILLVLLLAVSLLFRDTTGINRILLTCLAYATMFTGLGYSTTGWSKERFENYYLAKHAHEIIDRYSRVATIRVTPDIYVYYIGKPLTDFKSVKAFLEEYQSSMDRKYLLVMNQNELKLLPANIRWNVLYTTDVPRKAKTLVEILR